MPLTAPRRRGRWVAAAAAAVSAVALSPWDDRVLPVAGGGVFALLVVTALVLGWMLSAAERAVLRVCAGLRVVRHPARARAPERHVAVRCRRLRPVHLLGANHGRAPPVPA